MKCKARGIVAMKPNFMGCAALPCNGPVNWWSSQNPSAEDRNSTKNFDRSLPSGVSNTSRGGLSYPKSQGTYPLGTPVLHYWVQKMGRCLS